MARAAYYPPADRTTQDFYREYPALYGPARNQSTINTLVLHTTEGGSWPGYSAGSMAPTWTYDPRSHQMRQHMPLPMAARALVDLAGGVTTDRLNVAQIEIIGYAAQGGPLDGQAITDLGALLAWLHTEWDVPIVAPYPFVVPAHRMTFAEWNSFAGVCGHGHVPENTHWDPGAMNVPAILAAAQAHVGATGGVVAGGVTIPGTPTFPTGSTPAPAPVPAPTLTEDDMDVYAFSTSTGTGFRLRTAMGETDLGTMGDVDACMSAINATVTRTWDGTKWVLGYPYPCTAGEAAILASKIAAIRGATQPVTVTPAAPVDMKPITDAIAQVPAAVVALTASKLAK